MATFARLPAAVALIALLVWPVASAMAGPPYHPRATTTGATAVTGTSATLRGDVSHLDTYRFEYGPSTSYGQSTPIVTERHHQSADVLYFPVSSTISGLLPDTVYHYRVTATGHGETARGADATFTTAAAPGTPTTTGPPAADPTELVATPFGMPQPTLGDSVVVAPAAGTIRLRLPGSTDYVTLEAGDDIPVGTIVDTRVGTVTLTSAVDATTSQSAQFNGAKFEVRQAANGGGVTDLLLRGANFKNCPETAGTASIRAASTSYKRSKRPKRRLWSRDKGGRFRTHGRNSVATVRGTVWSTTDTCAGTRTTVREGSVAVFDRGLGKTVIVRPGRNYLARSTG